MIKTYRHLRYVLIAQLLELRELLVRHVLLRIGRHVHPRWTDVTLAGTKSRIVVLIDWVSGLLQVLLLLRLSLVEAGCRRGQDEMLLRVERIQLLQGQML